MQVMEYLTLKLKTLLCRPLVTGTLILTVTGLLSRLIGFFYRIYLSRLFGEENMGIYQLISPVVSLSFSLTAAGFQTAVSKLAAELAAKNPGRKNPLNKKPFWAALSISLPLSLICTVLTYALATPIGTYVLKEERTISLLRIIAFSFPFVGVHACINGWFYGMKKAGLPSFAQIMEQLTRVTCVYVITARDISRGVSPSVSSAVFGLAVGELVSMGIGILTFLPYFSKETFSEEKASSDGEHSWNCIFCGLLSMAVPLTANRLTLTLLGSAESVAIPQMLRLYGYDNETALSVYGVLTGMALPLIFFPNALTGSIAVLLLPMISENYCLGKTDVVRSLTLRTIKYCLYVGLSCLTVFVLLGPFLGNAMFHSALAGRCIRTLGWICPFLYLDVMLSSILQGLGKAGTIFGVNVLCLMVRLSFVCLAVPCVGIKGYLWGMLASQLLLTLLYGLSLRKTFRSQK